MKGIYILLISIDKDIDVKIGSLGVIKFKEGLYAYVGSAQNSLEKRIMRHLRKDKKRFWHIDYLLDNESIKVNEAFYKVAGKHEECEVAEKIRKQNMPVVGFGSSDCKCRSHLFKVSDHSSLRKTLEDALHLKPLNITLPDR